jgi:hypothetical protein
MSTSRDVLRAALAHQQPARIPLDFGATPVTGIHVSCVGALRNHYGLARRPVKVHEPYQMLGLVEDDLQRAMGLDVEGIPARKTMFGFPVERWKEWRTPWAQDVLVPHDFVTVTDADGALLIHPEGDAAAPPSGKMPVGSYFFDTIVRQEPFDEDNPVVEDNLEEFGALTEEDLAYFAAEASRASATGRGVIANVGGTGLGDIALVPAPFLKRPKGIRDVAEWYMSTATRRDFIHAIFARQTEIALLNLRRAADVLGDRVDVLYVCGTDFGTQSSAFCSVDTFRELWLPYYKKLNDWVHANTTWKTFKHSCGAVEKFVSSFIGSGFDILNPVQCSAAGMDARQLKDRYGDRIVFWGGGVDTQRTLPFGTPAQVREEVLQRCQIFSKGGGFVFNAVHNVQARTPVENIVAMIDAVNEFDGRAH